MGIEIPSPRQPCCPDPLEELTTRASRASALRKKSYEMLHRRLVHVGKTLTGFQILGCELHQNAFGGRALPGPTGGAIALPRPFSRY